MSDEIETPMDLIAYYGRSVIWTLVASVAAVALMYWLAAVITFCIEHWPQIVVYLS